MGKLNENSVYGALQILTDFAKEMFPTFLLDISKMSKPLIYSRVSSAPSCVPRRRKS